ncbi:hypothetical protein ACQUSR_09520 [Streptomyces sp. P1-3]|uniref:hypothetical protein n=1 Tax=Streptomyces sp. P1-3 TaxID=3421658 RepID=UPI003D36B05A
MRRPPYDQRVLALIEVRGGVREWKEAEALFATHGWPVVEFFPCGQGPSLDVLPADASSRLYAVEVRLHGAAYRAERGAVWRVQRAARTARLTMYVRRAARLVRERDQLPEWRVHTTAHRVSGPRLRTRVARRMGRYDTGAITLGTPREALRLSRIAVPGGPGARTDVAVRPLDERWSDPRGRLADPEDKVMAFLAVVCSCLLAAVSVGTDRFPWAVLCALATCAVMWAGSALQRGGRDNAGAVTIVLGATCFLASLAVVSGGRLPERTGPAASEIWVVPLIAVVGYGLWLMARRWTWGEWVAWAVPLVVSVVVSTLLGAGSVLHALYAESLSLTADDLDVPGVWQALSAAKLLTYLVLVLVVPALWGVAKHLHYVGPTERFNGFFYIVMLVLCVSGVSALAAHYADSGAQATIAAAKQRRPAPAYLGVEPEWTCVQPTVPVERLPGEGGRLDPARPYLLMGVGGGNAVLLSPGTGEPLKLPASKVRLVPAKSARVTCGR